MDQPSLINLYNNGMGGLDRFEEMTDLYKSKISSQLFRFSLDGSKVNILYLHRGVLKTKRKYVFTRVS